MMNKFGPFAFLAILLLLSGCSANERDSYSDAKKVQDSVSISLDDKVVYQMSADKVIKNIDGNDYDMLGYNGEIPGPTIRAKQGSTVYINFTNNLDEPTTVHWHGLRHNYRNDGMPGISQDPILPGESFLYELNLPDDGVFWYHPHIKEEEQQDLGLYGNIIVEPNDLKAGEYNDVDIEEILAFDDILIENGKIVSYGENNANFALMGRYGNVMLTNGKTDYSLNVKQGDTVRFYVTVVSNVRPYNFSINNTKLKIVGGDIGLYAKEKIVDSILLVPAERYIIEARFDDPGEYSLSNINPWFSYTLGKIIVSENPEFSSENIGEFSAKTNPLTSADIEKYMEYFDKPVDVHIDMGVMFRSMNMVEMHSESQFEWEDFMAEENRDATSDDLEWFLRDRSTNLRGEDLLYSFNKDDIVKIKFSNNNMMDPHPMQHYIHLHGQRFLVLEVDGVKNDDLVWKDTFLMPNGGTATILLDASNSGIWMMHCHIPEHLSSGMMALYEVLDEGEEPSGIIPGEISAPQGGRRGMMG